ncbi:MAG: hypothetical protein AMXMBFR84_29490 [Candidatus Hydrogenedentota bacterium]
MKLKSASLLLLGVCAAAMPWAAAQRAAVVDGPQGMPAYDALVETVEGSGYPADRWRLNDLTQPIPETIDLIVLCEADQLPAAALGPFMAFLERGGDVIALGTPAWTKPLIDDDGEWLNREAFVERHHGELMPHVIASFADGDLSKWKRNASDPGITVTHHVEREGETAYLDVRVPELTNWETYVLEGLETPFAAGHDLTVIRAKGGASTTSLAVEWIELDSSRWIATVPLTETWQTYILTPEDFAYWESVPERKGTRFDPARAVTLSIGLAQSHTRLSAGPHAYSIEAIGSARRSPVHEKAMTRFDPPKLESLSPTYKFFDLTDVSTLKTCTEFPESVAPPKQFHSLHPRPSAGGLNKGRAFRFQPVLEAYSAEGKWRGCPAALMAYADGPYEGGVWVSFAIRDSEWYASYPAQSVLGATLQGMRRGAYLLDAGADHYTYFEGQNLTIGARVANVNPRKAISLILRVELQDPDQGGTVVHAYEQRFVCASGETKALTQTIAPPAWGEHGLRAVTTLWDTTGQFFDRAVHEIHVWKPKSEPEFVTVENGDFRLKGERWRAHGVNYMPSSGIGIEDSNAFEYWIGEQAYDPGIVQRDLERIQSMGFNSVSIFIYRQSMEAQNLLDLLRRLDALGLKANLSLRPGTPLDFPWDAVREMIEFYKLSQNDTVFAYDLAWEPMFGNHKQRKVHDAEWRAWLDERYGGIESAERDWGFSAPREADGQVTNPLEEHITGDGLWRVMTAAYRRFLDTVLYEKYARARRLVRSVDPHHLVSFRMTLAGDPTFRGGHVIPYSWSYLAGAVDILEPEAYGRIGDWDRVRPGRYQYELARWARADAPVLWAEAGVQVWSEARMAPSPDAMAFQADYYRNLYRMFTESAADGVYFWWYPGGYRTNERSDYGILNPDGTDRPVTAVIRELGSGFISGPDAKAVDDWITVDFDEHPDGVAGVYDATHDAYWKGIDAGKTPGLKTAGTGTTTATCPRVAVGNTALTGTNPPKYIDGFFDRVAVQLDNGDWREIKSGDTVGVNQTVRVSITNVNEATWLAAGDAGAVALIVDQGGQRSSVAIPQDVERFQSVDLDFSPSGAGEINLRLEASGVSAFGPVFRAVVTE